MHKIRACGLQLPKTSGSVFPIQTSWIGNNIHRMKGWQTLSLEKPIGKQTYSNATIIHCELLVKIKKKSAFDSPNSQNKSCDDQMPIFCSKTSEQGHCTPQQQTENKQISAIKNPCRKSKRNATDSVNKYKHWSSKNLVLTSSTIIIPNTNMLG